MQHFRPKKPPIARDRPDDQERTSASHPHRVKRPAEIGSPQPSWRLARIHDWPELAREAGYSVKGLAQRCKVSVRTLETFFSLARGEPPHRWLNRLRMRRAIKLLRHGANVNETAGLLGYQEHSQFSRAFKRRYGAAPSRHANLFHAGA